jgi:hypothetical protein
LRQNIAKKKILIKTVNVSYIPTPPLSCQLLTRKKSPVSIFCPILLIIYSKHTIFHSINIKKYVQGQHKKYATLLFSNPTPNFEGEIYVSERNDTF